jgi:flagellar export protein FliJ
VNGLAQWHRLLESDLRERKLALARARLALERAEQVAALLVGERERRDEQERARRAAGEMPDFTRERLNVLLERAVVRAKVKVADGTSAVEEAAERLREAWRRVAGIDRLIQRRDEREAFELRRRDQKELDELASTRHHASVRTDAREASDALRLAPAGDGAER